MTLSQKEAVLLSCYNELDTNFFNNFADEKTKRIIFQKYGLFFEHFFDLKLGEFSLYIYGPYNSDLADFGYKIARNPNLINEITGIKLTENVKALIDILKTNFQMEATLLEVYSTYLYLQEKKKLSEQALYDRLVEIKGHLMTPTPQAFFDAQIRPVITRLNGLSLETAVNY